MMVGPEWNETLYDCWRHGAKISLVKHGRYFLVNIYYAFGNIEETVHLHSEFCEVFWFYTTLAAEMADIDSLVFEEEDDEDFADWLIEALGYKNEPFVECPFCKLRVYAKSTIYRMMRGFNISQDMCWLECPKCGKEFQTYGYDEYYKILLP